MCTLGKRGKIFFLTLTGDGEHRLSPELIEQVRSALRQVHAESTRGIALVTKGEGKFFSNGFDLAWAQAAGSESAAYKRLQNMIDLFQPLVANLISLPMPTIAAVSDHAAAAGFLLALSHDYVLMRRDKGVIYMSELDIGLSLPEYCMALMRLKINSPIAGRNVALTAARVKADEAVKMGMIDSAHDSEEDTMEAAVRQAEQLTERNWDGEVYADIRKSSFPELCGVLGLIDKPKAPSKL